VDKDTFEQIHQVSDKEIINLSEINVPQNNKNLIDNPEMGIFKPDSSSNQYRNHHY